MSPDLERIFELVKTRTGYPVSVTPMAEGASHATMRSATPEAPVHAIFPNPKYERFANYLVAVQCGMLLFKWGDGSSVADFVVNDEKLSGQVRRAQRTFEKQKLPPQAARQYAEHMVKGALRQLSSTPLEILTDQWCFDECPNLRSEQQMYVTAYLRELSEVLEPRVRKMTPPDIYERSVKMNCAYTMAWSEQSGETAGLLPYESLGYKTAAAELLSDLKSIPTDSSTIYVGAVDAWAKRLSMTDWFEWNFRTA